MVRYVKILLLASQILFCARSWAWTEVETNMVGLALARVIALTPEDCELVDYGGNDDEPLDEPFPTFGSLFEESLPCAQDWTTEAKRAAFFHYLDTLPGSVTNGVFCGDEWFASSALGFCRVKGDAAVLQPAMGVLAATNMPDSCQWESAGIFEKWVQPTEAMNSYLDGVLSGEGRLNDAKARRMVYDAYANKLGQVYDAGQTNLATNGAAILYRGLSVGIEAPSVDALLLRIYPDYAVSSNRLWVAELALGNEQSRAYVANYFAPITNALLNAEQPLPVVEGL